VLCGAVDVDCNKLGTGVAELETPVLAEVEVDADDALACSGCAVELEAGCAWLSSEAEAGASIATKELALNVSTDASRADLTLGRLASFLPRQSRYR
jgi:hypothetical protein